MPNVKVRITSETEEQQTGGMGTLAQRTSAASDTSKTATTSLFVNAISSNIKQAVRFGLSNVGNFTGDYIKQSRINNALEVISNVSTVAMGALSSGWVGAVVATASIALRVGFQEVSRQNDMRLGRIQSQFAMERTGNQLFDGSRSTED